MINRDRRNFFRKTLVQKTLACICETQNAFKQGMSEDEYFRTFENAYPLISECYDFLEDEAQKLGIDTRDKSKLDLARAIHMTLQGLEV